MNLWNLCILRFGFAVSSIRLGASAVMLARLDPGIVCSLITGPPVVWTLFLSRSHWNVFLPSWGICLSPRTWTSQSWLLRLLWTVLTSGPAVFALAVGGEQGVSRCLASQGKSSKKHMYRNWPVTKTPKPQNPKTTAIWPSFVSPRNAPHDVWWAGKHVQVRNREDILYIQKKNISRQMDVNHRPELVLLLGSHWMIWIAILQPSALVRRIVFIFYLFPWICGLLPCPLFVHRHSHIHALQWPAWQRWEGTRLRILSTSFLQICLQNTSEVFKQQMCIRGANITYLSLFILCKVVYLLSISIYILYYIIQIYLTGFP